MDNEDIEQPMQIYTLYDLNDDCLLKIIKYLSFRDQVLFASLNQRFQDIMFMHLRVDNTYILDLNYTKWSLTDLYIAFNLIGPITKQFEITKNNDNLSRVHICVEFVLEYCRNLLSLKLESIQNINKNICQMSQMLQKLVTLNLRICSLIDDDVKLLSKLKEVEHLDLSKNAKLSGKHIEKFKQLKTLKLAKCNQIKEINLIPIFQKMKNLQHLDLQHCSDLNESGINTLIDNCKSIETLKIYIRYATESLKRISELKELKNLHIEEGWSYGNSVEETRRLRNIVNNLLKMLSNQLVSLKIHFLQFDHDKGLNWDRFDAIYSLIKLEELNFVGYLSCYVINWFDLRLFIENSNLKILNITYSNAALGFSSTDFNSFILACVATKKLNEINLKYSEHFTHSAFLDNFYEILDGKCNTKPTLKMKIKVSPRTKMEIISKPGYMEAANLSNLMMKVIRTSYDYYDHFRYMTYEEDEEIERYDELLTEDAQEESAAYSNGEIKITVNSLLLES